MNDAWIVNLSDGSTHTEHWVSGEASPWQRLMKYCRDNGCYITNLRLTIGKKTVTCPSNALGYWQAHGMPTVQGVENDEELHKWRGIGWVEGDDVNIIWGARDPQTHEVVFWHDKRPAKGQGQIIWARPQLATGGPIQGTVPAIATGVCHALPRNLKEYSNRL